MNYVYIQVMSPENPNKSPSTIQIMAVARELQAGGAKANTMAATRLLETAVRFHGRLF